MFISPYNGLFLSLFHHRKLLMKKVQRFVVWICKHFNREQILNIVDELTKVLNDKYSDLQPKDEFKDKHPNYRNFSVDPLAPLNAADIVKPKKT